MQKIYLLTVLTLTLNLTAQALPISYYNNSPNCTSYGKDFTGRQNTDCKKNQIKISIQSNERDPNIRVELFTCCKNPTCKDKFKSEPGMFGCFMSSSIVVDGLNCCDTVLECGQIDNFYRTPAADQVCGTGYSLKSVEGAGVSCCVFDESKLII